MVSLYLPIDLATYIDMSAYLSIYPSVRPSVCLSIFVYVCIYLCVHACMHASMCMDQYSQLASDIFKSHHEALQHSTVIFGESNQTIWSFNGMYIYGDTAYCTYNGVMAYLMGFHIDIDSISWVLIVRPLPPNDHLWMHTRNSLVMATPKKDRKVKSLKIHN